MPNSSAKKTNVECDLLGAVLGSNKNLRRHKKNVHYIQPPINQTTVKCDGCFEGFSSFAETIQHIEVLIRVSRQQTNSVLLNSVP